MSKVSILIPSRNEKYLLQTIESIYDNATGDFEVIVGFDGEPFQNLPVKPNLTSVMFHEPIGLKSMINHLVKYTKGKYIYKSDSHCMFGKGFDEILQENMEENWIVTPRFYVLDAQNWQWQDERFYDYFYLSCPFTDPRGIRFKAGGHWPERTKERLLSHPVVDETPSMHGSGWFMNKSYFEELGGFPEQDKLGHAQEPIWLGLKAWLSGGKLMVNKKTWYAHLHQQGDKRGYPEDKRHTEKTYKWTADYWLKNCYEKQIYDFDWFVKKFYPMPTWPTDWEVKYEDYKSK